MGKQTNFDTAEEIALRLEGTAAKLHVMAGAFQRGTEAPDNETIETALISVADEVAGAAAALLSVLEGGKA